MYKVFIHGLESSNQGTKAIYFAKYFPDMLIPHFKGDLAERMDQLHQVLMGQSDLILVGSSFGGLMATLFALENELMVRKMILLAPALNFSEFLPYRGQKVSTPVWLYLGRRDVVTPLQEVASVARETFLKIQIHEVDDDHLLRNTFTTIDWSRLLC